MNKLNHQFRFSSNGFSAFQSNTENFDVAYSTLTTPEIP